MKDLKGIQSCTSYAFFKTDIGWGGVVRNKKGLRRIFIGYVQRNQFIKRIEEEFGNTPTKEPSTGELIENIIRYCLGEKISFGRYKMDWSSLTPFQCRVLNTTMKIPYGTVTTYGSLARAIGCHHGSRAVGNALSKNPFPLLIPCHRVVRSDGKPGGFSAGSGKALKEKLLRMEHENL